MMKRVCIVGIGWLGEELALALKKLGYDVTGTTTSVIKADRLENALDLVKVFNLTNEEAEFLKGCEILIYTIPPSSSDNYPDLSKQFLGKVLETNPDTTIIYTSSTSVYGNEEREVHEESLINPSSASAKKVAEVEAYIKDTFKKYAIFRLGGLVGGKRHPVKYLEGRKGISKPLAPVNLIHRQDAIRAIVHIISHFKIGIYNLCSENHPLKKSYYNAIAKQYKMRSIEFDDDDFSKDKVVTCNAIKESGFKFKYRSPYDFPVDL